MLRKLTLLCAVLALSGCANPTVATPNQVVIAVNAFDAAEVGATAYLKLPLCGTGVCRTAAASKTVAASVRAGIVLRDKLQAEITSNGSAIPLTELDALAVATSTLLAYKPASTN